MAKRITTSHKPPVSNSYTILGYGESTLLAINSASLRRWNKAVPSSKTKSATGNSGNKAEELLNHLLPQRQNTTRIVLQA